MSECCLISYFDARKFWRIFVLAILKTNPFSHHLSKCNFFQNISLKRLEQIVFKSLHIISIMYIIMSETFIKIDYCNTLKFQDKTILRTGQKSALQQSLFWRYANFSKLMRTIHISMTSKFQCEYCQCFTIKRCDKFKLKCTSHGDMYSMHSFGKNSLTSKQWML